MAPQVGGGLQVGQCERTCSDVYIKQPGRGHGGGCLGKMTTCIDHNTSNRGCNAEGKDMCSEVYMNITLTGCHQVFFDHFYKSKSKKCRLRSFAGNYLDLF